MRNCNEEVRKELEEKTARDNTLRQSVQLLSNPDNNIEKLELAKEKSKMKIAKMESQWKRHKDLLDNKINALKKISDGKMVRNIFYIDMRHRGRLFYYFYDYTS